MKYLIILTVGVCLVLSMSLVAQEAPKPGPAQKLHGFLEGENSCEFKDGEGIFTSKCAWFGNGFFMTCHGRYKPASGSAVEFHTVQGYDPRLKVHAMYRFRSTGQIDRAKGWFDGNKITWVFDDEFVNDKWQRRQLNVEITSEHSWTFKWERSIEGQPWQVTQEGKCSKAKDTTN